MITKMSSRRRKRDEQEVEAFWEPLDPYCQRCVGNDYANELARPEPLRVRGIMG